MLQVNRLNLRTGRELVRMWKDAHQQAALAGKVLLFDHRVLVRTPRWRAFYRDWVLNGSVVRLLTLSGDVGHRISRVECGDIACFVRGCGFDAADVVVREREYSGTMRGQTLEWMTATAASGEPDVALRASVVRVLERPLDAREALRVLRPLLFELLGEGDEVRLRFTPQSLLLHELPKHLHEQVRRRRRPVYPLRREDVPVLVHVGQQPHLEQRAIHQVFKVLHHLGSVRQRLCRHHIPLRHSVPFPTSSVHALGLPHFEGCPGRSADARTRGLTCCSWSNLPWWSEMSNCSNSGLTHGTTEPRSL